MPAAEKQLPQEKVPSTITDLINEYDQILEAIRLLTDVADTQPVSICGMIYQPKWNRRYKANPREPRISIDR